MAKYTTTEITVVRHNITITDAEYGQLMEGFTVWVTINNIDVALKVTCK